MNFAHVAHMPSGSACSCSFTLAVPRSLRLLTDFPDCRRRTSKRLHVVTSTSTKGVGSVPSVSRGCKCTVGTMGRNSIAALPSAWRRPAPALNRRRRYCLHLYQIVRCTVPHNRTNELMHCLARAFLGGNYMTTVQQHRPCLSAQDCFDQTLTLDEKPATHMMPSLACSTVEIPIFSTHDPLLFSRSN